MNKKELVSRLAEQCEMTQVKASEFVDAFCSTVVNELQGGNAVAIPGFGQFVAKHRPARQVRNPSTGQTMMSKAKTACQFKPSAGLKDL